MKYDVVIIGAGSAGAILATRLSEDSDRSVLLLEAGPDYPKLEDLPEDVRHGYGTPAGHLALSHVWQFTARATAKASPMEVWRGKITGGSSAVNVQVFLRGMPEDYDTWASWGNTEWSFEKVFPYFLKLETDMDFHDNFHGANGPIKARRFKREEWLPIQRAFYSACRAAGFPDTADMNHPESTGVGPIPMNNPDGIRMSTALGYLSQARQRRNLTIRPNCLARRVLFNGKRAVGVEVESGGGIFTVEANEIILSAGAIGSPHILLLSGVGPADQLRSLNVPVAHHLPGVGKNLRDHPVALMAWQPHKDYSMDVRAPWLNVGLRYTASGSHLRNDVYTVAAAIAQLGVIWMRPSINLAVGSGELKLTSADPHVQPSLDYNYLQEPFDRERLREAVRLCIKLSEHDKFKGILGERTEPKDADLASDEALDDWMMRNVTTGDHISCTCKMGSASDPLAVVDQYGRVHGLEGLRVVDSSIMPDCPRANLNATIMMIGERVSDFIRQGI